MFLIRIHQDGIAEGDYLDLRARTSLKQAVAIHDDIKALQKIIHFDPASLSSFGHGKASGLQGGECPETGWIAVGFCISKSAQTVELGGSTLSEKQLEYAATDAWVASKLQAS